ncbi:MAG: alpha/beta fold hydrolase [Myxococcota bacterium]
MDMLGETRETVVDGTTIAWTEMGSGPPLVLLHGILDTHRTWRRVAPHLARRFRVLMPDLPGHGQSGRPDAPYTLAWYAQMVAGWMEAVGADRAFVCGHSFGGGVAQWMLLEHGRRIDRLALVAPGGLGREIGLPLRLAALPVLGKACTPLVLRFVLPVVLPLVAPQLGRMEPEERARLVRSIRVSETARAFHRSVTGVINVLGQHQQTLPRARELTYTPPIALFWGRHDPIIPMRHGRDTVACSAGVSLTSYEGCGHWPHLDVPDRFARDLLAFLAERDRPAATLGAAQKTWGRTLQRTRAQYSSQ